MAHIVCERSYAGVTFLSVKHLTPGTIPPYRPTIKLIDRYGLGTVPNAPPGPGIFHYSESLNGTLVVETDGPGWEGVIDNVWADSSGFYNFHNHVGTDGQTNVVANLRLDRLPTGGSWAKNGAKVAIKQPGAGTPQEYLCVTSGFGTWSSTASYSPGCICIKSGVLYMCIATNANSSPPSANWTTIAAWDSGTAYTVNTVVTNGGKVWQATGSSTGVAPGSGLPLTDKWHQIGVFAAAQLRRSICSERRFLNLAPSRCRPEGRPQMLSAV